MSERRLLVKLEAKRYRTARKKEKGRILDELVALSGYNRWYAVGLLRGHGKLIKVGRRLRLVGDLRGSTKRSRPRIYDGVVLEWLRKIWAILDCVCGKRLAAILPEVIAVLERHHEIALDAATRQELFSISPATIDRVLAPERRKFALRGRSGTKPGTLLKHQIPIRTFAEWNQAQPGFMEIDLVGHEGGDACGDFCQTLDVTDVASGWTESAAVINKAQVWVFEALKGIRARLPFPLLGIDSDNGSEFINNHLLRYCQQEKITFTRGCTWKKNDGCFVEQKNYSVVRRAVGYARYDSATQQRLLNTLYGAMLYLPYPNCSEGSSMSLYNNQSPACRVGVAMIRISITFFYGLGAALRNISGIKAGDPLHTWWYQILSAEQELRGLFSGEWFLPAVKSAYNPGQKLLQGLAALSTRTDFDTALTPMDAWNITSPLGEFETVLKNELAIADAYFVTRKAAYDTGTLIASAEHVFSSQLALKVPQSIPDIREGGKCLAFELPTGAGFHVLRATETVLRPYWTAVSGGKPHPYPRNMGSYLKKMDKLDIGAKKVRAVLRQIKDLHRNPLMHPEETLSLDDAIGLFGICQSAISAMLKAIPDPKPPAPPSATVSSSALPSP